MGGARKSYESFPSKVGGPFKNRNYFSGLWIGHPSIHFKQYSDLCVLPIEVPSILFRNCHGHLNTLFGIVPFITRQVDDLICHTNALDDFTEYGILVIEKP